MLSIHYFDRGYSWTGNMGNHVHVLLAIPHSKMLHNFTLYL